MALIDSQMKEKKKCIKQGIYWSLSCTYLHRLEKPFLWRISLRIGKEK
jgi:hypothetical protein